MICAWQKLKRSREGERERGRAGERESGRETQRETQRDTERHRDREGQGETERMRGTQRGRVCVCVFVYASVSAKNIKPVSAAFSFL